MKMLNEFKEFAIRGNVIDMAVGIIIGAAFTTVVQSLVNDILMPPIGILVGGIDFSDAYFLVKEGPSVGAPYETLQAAKDAGAVVISYGNFVDTLISFTIVAFAVFILVKNVNRLQRPPEDPAPKVPIMKKCPYCYSEINIEATRCPNCTSELQ